MSSRNSSSGGKVPGKSNYKRKKSMLMCIVAVQYSVNETYRLYSGDSP